jgi:DNA processing protein
VNELTEDQAYLILNALPNIGPVTVHRLLAEFGADPRTLLSAPVDQLQAVRGVGPVIAQSLRRWREAVDLDKELARLARVGARFVTAPSEGYPGLLRELHDPPLGLYCRGEDVGGARCVAIVGSRRATPYGLSVARTLAGDLARQGFWVVSGMARGIDTAAHEGALEAGGRTAAVLGCGLDIIYPPENLGLYRRIEVQGAVYSEFPFTRRADRQSFAMRNRVVAGMCMAVVVVETDVDGGSMITARFAGEQGRQLFAVPGRIDQPQSRGCHQLIRDGATLLTGIDDLLAEFSYLDGLAPGRGVLSPLPAPPKAAVELSGSAGQVWACFAGGERLAIDQIAARTLLPAAEIAGVLLLLEIQQLVSKRLDGLFEATLSHA